MAEPLYPTGGEADPRQARAILGRVISQRYRVDELVAMGGMGAVYAGTHVHMHKRVAIKILHPRVKQQPELVQRFEREAIAGAHIQHPNVAAATDFGELEDGSHFLVLEYVQGTTLSEVIRRGPVPVGRAIHVARQIAAALEATHAMGIVHRDVKPLNVMVCEGQRDLVKLIDFGFAKVPVERLSAEPVGPRDQTAAGVVFGSIAYLAPEAASGMRSVEPRSDLYALGLILYEMLAGKHAFLEKDPVDLFRQQMQERPAPIGQHAPGVRVPEMLEALVMRLLEKEPARRPEGAGAVIDALDDIAVALGLSSPSLDSYPPPAGHPAWARSTSTAWVRSTSRPPPASPWVGHPPPAPAPSAPPPAAWGVPSYPSAPPPTAWGVPSYPSATPPGAWVPSYPSATPPGAWGVPSSPTVPPPPAPRGLGGALARWRLRDGIAAGVAIGLLAVGALLLTLSLGGSREPVAVATAALRVPAVELPPAPPRDPGYRQALLEAVRRRQWDRASEALVDVALGQPAALRDRVVAAAAREAAMVVGRAGGEEADAVYGALVEADGGVGLDVLYDVLATRGSSAPAERAAKLLRSYDVAARGTPALRIAFQLRDAPCSDKLDLLDRAVAEGDRRALTAMETVVRFCFRQNPQLTDATKALRERLRKR